MKNDIGVITNLKSEGSTLQTVADFGLKTCQVACWFPEQFTTERADTLRRDSKDTGVRITSLWAGWPGPKVWDLIDGPTTLGLVPRKYRKMRVAVQKQAGDFARRAGLKAIVTHLGFIPESPKDPVFGEMVAAVKGIALHLKKMKMEYWFETGQETAVTMLRLIECVGTGNLGINLDPANLILYGKSNPIDALDVFGKHVKGVHAKDAFYPTDPMKLGTEVKVGTGRVRFPEFVKRLTEVGFKGAYIIEREISGAQQNKDIRATVRYLQNLLAHQSS